MKCLECGRLLRKAEYEGIRCFYCTGCQGVFFTISGLRSLVSDRRLVNQLWAQAKYGDAPAGKHCISCHQQMKKVWLEVPEREGVELDLCTRCQMVWFDAGELYEVPVREAEADVESTMPPEAREKLALARCRQAEAGNYAVEEEVSFLGNILACLGFPVELSAPPLQRLPLVTWGLVGLCLLAFIASCCYGFYDAVMRWGFIPAQAWRDYGLTWLTSGFLHGGVMHLIGNMYFLLIFGDNTEDLLGRWRFLLLVLAAEIAGNALHCCSAGGADTVPCVGASGFISGIIAFYCVALPSTRLLIRIKVWRSLQLYAWAWLLIWLLGQVWGAMVSSVGAAGGGVAFFSHLGGAAVGGVAGLWYQLRSRCRVAAASGRLTSAPDTGTGTAV